MIDHLNGYSFRKLAVRYDISKSSAWNIVHDELKKLPDNNVVTKKYCDRFSQIYLCDGKYIHVKGHKYKIPLLWGVDYFTHDIPVFTLASSENYQAWSRFFSYFRIFNTYPRLVVCDDNTNIKMAARAAFPEVKIQTCTNHFNEHIRRELRVKQDNRYRPFMREIERILASKLSVDVWNAFLGKLYSQYSSDPVALSVLTNIQRYKTELTSYRGISKAPLTTNLMECMNSHLESRLFSLRGFESFTHAKLWLNGNVLLRRYSKLVDCSGKFKKLNGVRPIDLSKHEEIDIPTFF